MREVKLNSDDFIPTRLCCGEQHLGNICPDGKVMCCLCFERVGQDKLNVTPAGEKEDVCLKCAAQEEADYKDRNR